MFTLAFIICTETACMSASPPAIFKTKEQCEGAGYTLIDKSAKQVEIGEAPPHRAVFQCISWGTPV